MRFRFIEDHRDEHPVRLMCRMLGVSPSGYHDWRGRPESAQSAANRVLLADIRASPPCPVPTANVLLRFTNLAAGL